MLVLSRRIGEEIIIGDDIVLTVVDVRNDSVRLGIKAPRSVSVNRAEVREAVEAENREAAQAAVEPEEMLRELGRPAPPTSPDSQG
ncbi:carbon storage regulator CsrA [Actinomycetaceae bacterium L2_0104]